MTWCQEKIGAPVRCLQMIAKVYEKLWTDGRLAVAFEGVRELLRRGHVFFQCQCCKNEALRQSRAAAELVVSHYERIYRHH